MPSKDPAVRHKWYLANKASVIARSKARRLRIQLENAPGKARIASEKRAAPKSCTSCGADITAIYPKYKMQCAECVASYMAAYRRKNAGRISALKKAWGVENREKKAASDAQYARDNPERRRNARTKWAANNKAQDAQCKLTNRMARSRRLPGWLTVDDLWLIAQIYGLSQLRTKVTGFAWNVDHILPLNGRKVSGLHVPDNLRVIPARDNFSKNNRFEVDGG
jgi:hypothetical protein